MVVLPLSSIFTASTKKHLEDLESRMEVLEALLLEENAKSKTRLQKEDIKRFIFKAIKKEPKQMIKLLVHHIVLYDDKIEIYYNFTDTKSLMTSSIRLFSYMRGNGNIRPTTLRIGRWVIKQNLRWNCISERRIFHFANFIFF